MHKTEALALADAIRNVKENVRYCRNCYNLAEEERVRRSAATRGAIARCCASSSSRAT